MKKLLYITMSAAFVHDQRGEFLGIMPRDHVWLFAKPHYTFTYDNIEAPLEEMEHACAPGDIVFCTIDDGKLRTFSKEQNTDHNARMTSTMARYYHRYPDEEVKPEFFSHIPILDNALEVWVLVNYPNVDKPLGGGLKLIPLAGIMFDYIEFVKTNNLLDSFASVFGRIKKLMPDRITEVGGTTYLICV